MKRFSVDISYNVVDTYYVEAEDETKAKELARELFAKMEIPSEHSELEDYTYVVNEI